MPATQIRSLEDTDFVLLHITDRRTAAGLCATCRVLCMPPLLDFDFGDRSGELAQDECGVFQFGLGGQLGTKPPERASPVFPGESGHHTLQIRALLNEPINKLRVFVEESLLTKDRIAPFDGHDLLVVFERAQLLRKHQRSPMLGQVFAGG